MIAKVFALSFRVALSLLALNLFFQSNISTAKAERRHGLSAFGTLKYPADFKHFDYVNPDAPKGGRLATIGTTSVLTFNHFNGFILKGDAAERLDLIWDSLMSRAHDEPDAVYGLVAEAADLAPDKMSVTFFLRAEARFHDGTKVTAEDVVFTLATLREKGHPRIQIPLRDVVEAVAIDPLTVQYRFRGENVRDLPMIVASLPIFSKAYYTANDFSKESLEPPLSSGPYKISDFRQGTYITYKRREDYWAADLPVNRGRYNFDEVRIEYFRERAVSLEAFKARAYDLREEFTSKSWATEYEFAAVRSGQVKKLVLPDGSPSGAQGFFLNLRRPHLADVRVRKALGLAFDFEWTNKNLFYGLYTRTASYFENSDLKADGLPSPAELVLLEPYRDRLPPEVFGEAVKPPVTDGSGRSRTTTREASQLLDAAGWKLQDGVRKNDKGDILNVEFLFQDVTTERIVGPYAERLRDIGVRVSLRRVEAAQEQERTKTYDFDITTERFSLSQTPGPEVKAFWSSEAGRQNGSYNLPGIADPIVDALIDKILQARTRDELRTACRAIDRVLRAGHYWVPHWFKASHGIAMWDKFSFPAVKPTYSRGIVETWWYDKEKAAKLGG